MVNTSSERSRSFLLEESFDPFRSSLSLSRYLRTSKINDLECFIHFLKGNVGPGYKLFFVSREYSTYKVYTSNLYIIYFSAHIKYNREKELYSSNTS